MTTSGVVNQTQLEVVSIIEKAVRMCGVLPSVLGAEQLRNARDDLALLLIALSNRGVNLWCVDKRVYAALVNAQNITLPSDTVDILKALYRNGTYTVATSYAGATATVDYTAAAPVAVWSASVLVPSAGDYHLVIESSDDGLSWTQAGSAFIPDAQAGAYIGIDATVSAAHEFWRVRETVLVVTLTAVTFVSSAFELPMAQLSRDDYTALPNKTFASQQPLQYFYDKQAPNPRLWLWPTLSNFGPQVVLWIQRQIQDVGDLSNTLDIPYRWQTAIVARLAAQICLELPKGVADDGRYQLLADLAETATRSAEDGEVDGGNVKMTPNIRGYTR